jgi:hypothetical protein
MLIITSTFVRPTTNVPYAVADQSFKDNRESNYVQSGKMLSREIINSEDNLTRVIVTTWGTRRDFEDFKIDPITLNFKEARMEHFLAHNILVTHEFEYIPSDGDTDPA